MGSVQQAAVGRLKRIAAAPYARAAVVTLLAAAALGQAAGQAVTLSNGGTAQVAAEYGLPLSLLALLATAPLAVYRPAAAAVAVTFGNAVALFSFGQLTAGGAAAELAAACWLGLAGGPGRAREPGLARGPERPGGPAGTWLSRAAGGATPGRYLALALAVPFAASGLDGGGWAAVLLAAAVPAAAGAGIAVWAGRLARTRSAAGEALADTVLAHSAQGERARIARELHDVVAHHISMIAVLSETGRLTTPGLPEAGARRFTEIGDTARAGLTEMRRLLGVLREDAGPAEPASPAGPPARQPQPGLAQLTELIDAAREASRTGTRLIISGPVAPLDPGVELAAYRIIQEALSNTRRHAPGAAVDVELRYSAAALRVRVRDNGPGPAAEGGHGLTGMRERAFSAGGSLYAGLAPGGGFLVEAVLPAGPGAVRPDPPAGAAGTPGPGGLAAGAGR